VFKVRMDEIEFLPEGALSGSTERFADRRWG
jgi:hypothetical protein